MSRPSRQLAAIMFTDIVGYTAMMGKDEIKGMELVRKNKEIQKPLVEKHYGSWLKEMGDGTLISFPTASEAIYCALEIQKNLDDQSELKLRIGIHLGEIIVEEGDVYGDGVNIASRLQSIADPGGVYISDSVQKAIRGNKAIHYAPLGELELKNVDYPVKTFALRGEFLPRPKETDEKHLSGRIWAEIRRRNVHRAAFAYLAFSFIVFSLLARLDIEEFIQNIVGGLMLIGLPFSVWMAWNFERSPEGLVRISSREAWENPYSDSQKKPFTGNLIIIGLLIIIIGLNVIPEYLKPSPSSEVEVNDMSIAVMPFDNFSADKQKNQHICDGVMVAVRNNLSRIRELKVTPHTSVEQYRTLEASAFDIGQSLNVSYLLQGSVQRIGDQLKVDIALVNTREDRVVWNESYEDDYSNLFSIQSQIASLVANELQIILSPEEQQRIDEIPTKNLEAWDLYLKGESLYTEMVNNDSYEGYDDANNYFKKALELDPTLSKAYLGLAKIYGYVNWDREILFENFLDSVRYWCELALENDLNDPEAYSVLAEYYLDNGKPNLGREQFKRALALDPNDANILFYYGYSMIWRSDPDYVEGIRMMTSAIKNDPYSIDISERLSRLSWAYINIGDHNKAHTIIKEALRQSKSFQDSIRAYNYLTHSNLIIGNVNEALLYGEEWSQIDPMASRLLGEIYCVLLKDCEKGEKEYQKAVDQRPDMWNVRQRLAMAKMINGKSEGRIMLESQLEDWEEVTNLGRGTYYDVAGMNAFLGNHEEAYRILEFMNETHTWMVGLHDYTGIDPFFNSIRDEPRFQSIMNETQMYMDSVRQEVDKLDLANDFADRFNL